MTKRDILLRIVSAVTISSAVFIFCAYNSATFRLLRTVSYEGWGNSLQDEADGFHSLDMAETDGNVSSLLHTVCPCQRAFPSRPLTSTCGSGADLRGPKQNVVTYTLFGNPDSNSEVFRRYFASLRARANRVAESYPDLNSDAELIIYVWIEQGWTMRVYHNFTSDDPLTVKYLCQLHCHYEHVDLCNVTSIDNKELRQTTLKNLNPRMWRFLVMLDPLVDQFISRDIDSDIIPREVAAVQQWLNSTYTFHVMRDHPSHGGYMLAGLWGAKPYQKRTLVRNLGYALILAGQDQKYETDQSMLDMIVWPFATFDVMAHDAYFCNNWMFGTLHVSPFFPFPTQRDGRNYTGYDITRKDIADMIKMCPRECRPPEHKNWLFC